ncbi:MAG: amidase [Sphingopyxis sp.]
MSEVWQQSASALAARIAARETTSAEVIEAHLARIDAVNPALNAIVRVLADEARAGAAAADAKQASGAALGPLHGVPFTVKENIDMAGLPTTWGVPALAGAVVPADAPIVERMRSAGAIPIGRTNLPDMGLRVHTDSSLHGLTRNPWHQGRTAGGSSGGEGSAIASGMSPIGLGNDIGGSLRNPANACGIASIKPTQGRVPDAGYVPSENRLMAFQAMLAHGPMARSVADVRLGLQILNGAHPRDPWSVDMPFAGKPIDGAIKVAVVPEPPGGSTNPIIAATVRAAADALANAGYDVTEACPPDYEAAIECWSRFLLGDMSCMLPQLSAMMGPDAMAFLTAANAATEPVKDTAEMSQLYAQRDGIARAWSLFHAGYPLVLTPTWTQLPFEHGFDAATPEGAAATTEMFRPVTPANLLGLPSACVPAGRDGASGMPIGVLVGGARFRDDLCLDAAEVIERGAGVVTPITPRW